MKVAVILGGPYRGNELIVENHNHFMGKYDTYVSCFDHYKQNWLDSGWNIKELYETPKVNFQETNWAEYRDDEPGQSGFWQFWNLKSVIEKTPDEYDWYIKDRSDLIYEKLDLNEDLFLSLKPKVLYCAELYGIVGVSNQWDEKSLLNDQFYIGDRDTMNVISKFVTDYYMVNRHQKNASEGNEFNLRAWLRGNDIGVEKLPDIIYRKNYKGNNLPSGLTGYELESFKI